jgi:hypothetical protein
MKMLNCEPMPATSNDEKAMVAAAEDRNGLVMAFEIVCFSYLDEFSAKMLSTLHQLFRPRQRRWRWLGGSGVEVVVGTSGHVSELSSCNHLLPATPHASLGSPSPGPKRPADKLGPSGPDPTHRRSPAPALAFFCLPTTLY